MTTSARYAVAVLTLGVTCVRSPLRETGDGVMASNEPAACGFSCPFDGEARERIVILETEQKHTRLTQDQMLDELKAIRAEISTLTHTLIEQVTKTNTAASVGFTALSLWTKAVAFVLGGIGTLFAVAWALVKYFGVKAVIQ